MRIRILSDIHLELLNKKDFDKACINLFTPFIDHSNIECLILAGDIGNPYEDKYVQFLNKASTKYNLVVVITGNHEYYNNDIFDTDYYLDELCKNMPKKNIIFLNNHYYDYKGYRFIGSTLWSDISDLNDNHLNSINDLTCIYNFNKKLYNELHNTSVFNIRDILESTQVSNNKKKCIIITHHMPLYSLIHSKYKRSGKNSLWFASNLEELCEKYNDKINCWIYGHTHTATDTNINSIRYICNPIGYKGENPCPNWLKVIDI